MPLIYRLSRTLCISAASALFLALHLSGAKASLIPPQFLNFVVALGTTQPVGQPPHPAWVTEGTGFLYGGIIKDDPDVAKRQYQLFLITARHVVEEHMASGRGDLQVRVNPKEQSSPGQEFTLPNHPAPGLDTWIFHPNSKIDIAAIPINPDFLRERGYDPAELFFAGDVFSANRNKLKDLEVSAGDGIFVLGFPMNLAGVQRNYVIVRQGSVARISEMLAQASSSFLIDAFVFPGNSGSPVILRPEISSIQGTKSQSRAYLIGVVTSYVPYIDMAISAQTKRPRVTFEENSGLAEVIPTDYIDETIAAWREKQKNNAQTITPSINMPAR